MDAEMADGNENAETKTLDDLPDELRDSPLPLRPAMQLSHTIKTIAEDGRDDEVDVYINGDGMVNRVCLVEGDEYRKLAYTTGWKWLGPYEPDNPHEHLEESGYVRATERAREAVEEADEDGAQEGDG